jgi:hypothetical protein
MKARASYMWVHVRKFMQVIDLEGGNSVTGLRLELESERRPEIAIN